MPYVPPLSDGEPRDGLPASAASAVPAEAEPSAEPLAASVPPASSAGELPAEPVPPASDASDRSVTADPVAAETSAPLSVAPPAASVTSASSGAESPAVPAEAEPSAEAAAQAPEKENASAAPRGKRSWFARLGLFLAGFVMGVLFICVYFSCIYALFYWLLKGGMAGKTALILLAVLGVLGMPLFFVLSRLVRRIGAGRYAFPLGAFLFADAALLAIPLMDLMAPAKLMAYAGGNQDLARVYAYSLVVMITALVFLVLCWLVSVLFVAFRYFQNFAPGTDNRR